MIHNPFARAAAEAVARATGLTANDFVVSSPPRPELGDFAVACFPAAKASGRKPPEVAAEIAAGFVPGDGLVACKATGPFVNFTADRAAAFGWLCDATLGDEVRLVPRSVGEGQTVVIDYSSPNISKQLAYHHIRSTCIGHALVHLHRALGYRVIGLNHLGDWGTTHGMLLAAQERWPIPDDELEIARLNDNYVKWRAAAKEEPALEAIARAWFKRLEDGEPVARATWQRFRDVSWAEFQRIYDILGINFEEVRGESAYEDAMPGVIAALEAKGLTSTSQDALVVELEGEKVPLLLKTKDGTTLYATRDLASAIYRWETYQFARSLYVVDRGQAMHFRQVFKTLALMGYAWASQCEHIQFGLVRLGGKKTSTRATGGKSEVILLERVFDEAIEDVKGRIKAEGLEPAAVAQIARTVGVGAVVFANLAPQRERDVDFEWEKVLSIEGDSGPYLQYSHARCASILRKSGEAVPRDADLGRLTHDAEWAVAKRLLELGDTVARSAASCEPHILAHYLLDLAGEFSRWYTTGNGDAALRVLCDDTDTRKARLALTAAVRAALAHGLGLLGLGAPDVM